MPKGKGFMEGYSRLIESVPKPLRGMIPSDAVKTMKSFVDHVERTAMLPAKIDVNGKTKYVLVVMVETSVEFPTRVVPSFDGEDLRVIGSVIKKAWIKNYGSTSGMCDFLEKDFDPQKHIGENEVDQDPEEMEEDGHTETGSNSLPNLTPDQIKMLKKEMEKMMKTVKETDNGQKDDVDASQA